MDRLGRAGDAACLHVPGHARAGKTLVSLACALLAVSLLILTSGCGGGAAVNNYTTKANLLLADINAKEGALKNYWTEPVFQQVGLTKALADYRKALAAGQEMLDSTDFPEPCRKLDDLLGRAVDQGRALADIDTQFADYMGGLAPLGKQGEDIVSGIGKLETSTDVPSAVAKLADQARTLDSQVRTLSTSAQFANLNDEFQAFADLAAKNLTEAQNKLGKTSGYTNPNDQNSTDNQINTDESGTVPETQSGRRSKQLADSVSSYTDPIVDGWGTLNGELTAQLDQVMQAVGLKAKVAEVEGYVGQAVQQIQELEKQYK
jgi:hypothetical protein